MSARPPYVLLGNGPVAARYLTIACARNYPPALVVLNAPDKQRDGEAIRAGARTCGVAVVEWDEQLEATLVERLDRERQLWLLSVYFGHILKPRVLEAAGGRAVNLHPSLLPWCRGAHTNVWPILERCPAGVTLHAIVAEVDGGPVVAQREVAVHPWDTAETLYARLCDVALELLASDWPEEVLARWPGTPQEGQGSRHVVADFRTLHEYTMPEYGDARRLFDLLRARSFPPYPGLRIRTGDTVLEATLQLRRAADE